MLGEVVREDFLSGRTRLNFTSPGVSSSHNCQHSVVVSVEHVASGTVVVVIVGAHVENVLEGLE